jgi:hypothetical protein
MHDRCSVQVRTEVAILSIWAVLFDLKAIEVPKALKADMAGEYRSTAASAWLSSRFCWRLHPELGEGGIVHDAELFFVRA